MNFAATNVTRYQSTRDRLTRALIAPLIGASAPHRWSEVMTFRLRATLAVLAGLAGTGLHLARAQSADEIEAHLAAAKKAAGFDFAGTLVRTCVAPQTGPGGDVAPGPAPDPATYVT